MAMIMLSLTYLKQKKATKTYIPACQHLKNFFFEKLPTLKLSILNSVSIHLRKCKLLNKYIGLRFVFIIYYKSKQSFRVTNLTKP